MEKIPRLNWAIAAAIKGAREAKGLTQGQLAGLAGLSEIYITQLECGIRGDSLNALIQIAKALEIRAADLMHDIEAGLARGPAQPLRRAGRPRKNARNP